MQSSSNRKKVSPLKNNKKHKTEEDEVEDSATENESETSSENKTKKRKEKEKLKNTQEDKINYKLIFNDRFEIQSAYLLGKGSFGEIYLSKETNTRQYVALKLESQKSKQNQLKTEKHVLETMSDIEGFPAILSFGNQHENNFLAMELLGPNLSDLYEFCNNKFSLQCVLLLGIQILTRIQELHSKNYIHRDIKPENFLIGIGENSNLIYCIDFGLSKKYKDSKMDNIPYKENKPLTGTARYASINNHLGIEQSRRDDLESIGYLLIYFLKKRLPWQGCQGSTKMEKYNKILEKKLSISTEALCKDYPIEFSVYMNYVKNLKYNERPDYMFLKTLFIDLLNHFYTEKFVFDWNLPNPYEDPPNLKIGKKTNTDNDLSNNNINNNVTINKDIDKNNNLLIIKKTDSKELDKINKDDIDKAKNANELDNMIKNKSNKELKDISKIDNDNASNNSESHNLQWGSKPSIKNNNKHAFVKYESFGGEEINNQFNFIKNASKTNNEKKHNAYNDDSNSNAASESDRTIENDSKFDIQDLIPIVDNYYKNQNKNVFINVEPANDSMVIPKNYTENNINSQINNISNNNSVFQINNIIEDLNKAKNHK